MKQAKKANLNPHERTSEVQMSLKYAQKVAEDVTDRRRAQLERRRQELLALPMTHPNDLKLRDVDGDVCACGHADFVHSSNGCSMPRCECKLVAPRLLRELPEKLRQLRETKRVRESEFVLCICGHSVNAHLNSETQCNGCCCRKFTLDVGVAKEALKVK